MLKIDRRIIFLVIGLCTLLPLLYPVGLPIKISSEVRGVYNHIESLPERAVFFMSFDFDPASKPELHPQAIALLRHAFRKNLRVVTMTLWVTGTGLADQIVTQVAKEMGKENGKDYVFLGWSPGNTAVIINLGQNLHNTFPSDYGGKPTKGLPVLDGVQSLKDVTYLVSLGAGNPGVEAWYVFGKDKYKFEMGGGCTGVMAPGLYPQRPHRRPARRGGIRKLDRSEGQGCGRHGCAVGDACGHHCFGDHLQPLLLQHATCGTASEWVSGPASPLCSPNAHTGLNQIVIRTVGARCMRAVGDSSGPLWG